MTKLRVLFVCLGNICRSPMAQGSLQQQVQVCGLSEVIEVDSCGTAAFNVGKPPDPRAIQASGRVGMDISGQVARQIDDSDYLTCQYIIAMDRNNLSNVIAWAPEDYAGEIKLLLDYAANGGQAQVADPYYQEAGAFDATLAEISHGTQAVLDCVRRDHSL